MDLDTAMRRCRNFDVLGGGRSRKTPSRARNVYRAHLIEQRGVVVFELLQASPHHQSVLSRFRVTGWRDASAGVLQSDHHCRRAQPISTLTSKLFKQTRESASSDCISSTTNTV